MTCNYPVCVNLSVVSHWENRRHHIQWGDKDTQLSNEASQKQGPRGFTIGLTVSKDLSGEWHNH